MVIGIDTLRNMGFLDRLRASQSSGLSDWQHLTKIEQLEEIDSLPSDKTAVIFKHSTTCGISAGAKNRLEVEWPKLEGEIVFYYLDLLSYRHISNEIASRYGVRHESPQIIVINGGKATHDTSHHRISVGDLNKAIT